MPVRRVEPPERPDLYVVARFLDRLRNRDTRWTRSKLQHAVRLNYDLFRAYLAFLEEKGFVQEIPAGGAAPAPRAGDPPSDDEGPGPESESEPDPPEPQEAVLPRQKRQRTVIQLTQEGHAAHDRLVAWIRDVLGDTRL